MVRMGYKKLTVDDRNFESNEEESRLKKVEPKKRKKRRKNGRKQGKGIKDADRGSGKKGSWYKIRRKRG